jgi:serine/threonine protein kinase
VSEPSDQEPGENYASHTTPVLPLSDGGNEGGGNDGAPGDAETAALPGDAEPTAAGKAGVPKQHLVTDRQPQLERPPRPALGLSNRASTSGSGSSENRLPPGMMLAGRYRIVDMLGRGGMGEVYSADDTILGQRVALKLLPEKYAQDTARIDRLRSEVRLARTIAHPHVCRVYDIGQAEGRPFLSMECIDGENLDDLLRRIGRVPADRAVEIGVQICRGLAAIHDSGILHRDLKPANIMLDGRGLVRIADFGLASVAEQVAEQSGMQGTPAYMAPEQLGAREVTVQSDLYALGLILHKLLTGRPAFEARTPQALYAMRSEAAPPPPSTLVRDIPPAIDAIITRCLAPNPRLRPASAREIETVLVGMAPGQAAALVVAVASAALDRAKLAAQLGDDAATRVIQAHAQIFDDLCRQHGGTRVRGVREVDGALVLFTHPGDAMHHALAYQREVQALARREGMALPICVGMHLGVRPRAAMDTTVETEDLVELRDEPRDEPREPRDDIDKATCELATRLSKLAGPGQILLTRALFDLARQDAQPAPGKLQWLAHGSYELSGMTEPVEVCEVGAEGVAPLAPPADSDLARRRRVQEVIAGWRPAPGMELPEDHGRPHWRMERKLGQGGFGEVWLAEHAKTHERRVFKFCYDAEKLRALQRELTLFRLLKETLGDRRDIVRILECNFDRAPYFIESAYTPGGNLIEWAAAQGGLSAIPIDTRLAIVAQVATALAAAHSVGVLHKDVKPANVLMASDAECRAHAQLGDFGIGAITEKERLAEAGITAMGLTADARTNLGATPDGTRLYMAPERLEGKPATMQADVYALGVMLYQIVAGDFTRALAPGWERDIEDELVRADIAAAVDGDPARRLGSAAQLAERLEKLEQRRQELAERERQIEVTRQAQAAMARARSRRKILAVAATALVLVASIVVFQSLRIAREARAAEAAAQKAAVAGQTAQQVSDFLVALFEEADPYTAQGRDVTAREVLDRGKAKIAELDAQPEVQATLLHVMGVVYGNIGLYQESATLLERAVEKRRQLHGDQHLTVADSLHALAWAFEHQQAYERAERAAREALTLRRKLLGDEHLDTAETLELVADVLGGLANYHEAELLFQRVLAIRRRLLGTEHGLIAQVLRRTGTMRLELDEPREANRWYWEALEMYRRLPGDHTLEIAKTTFFMGLAHSDLDEPTTAESLFLESLTTHQKRMGGDHPMVARVKHELARLYGREGQHKRAEHVLLELRDWYRKATGEDSPPYATVLADLAVLARLRADCKEADSLSRTSLSIYQRAFTDDHAYIADGLDDRGYLLESWGDMAAAESHYRDSLAIFQRLQDGERAYAVVVMANLANLYVITGRMQQAHELIVQAWESLELQPQEDWRHEHVSSVRGAYLGRTGEHASAERLLLSAYNWLRQHYGAHRHYTQRALKRIVMFYEAQGRFDKAGEYRALLDEPRCSARM